MLRKAPQSGHYFVPLLFVEHEELLLGVEELAAGLNFPVGVDELVVAGLNFPVGALGRPPRFNAYQTSFFFTADFTADRYGLDVAISFFFIVESAFDLPCNDRLLGNGSK
jgi:hypothetical protein